jgi:hypothetical protein
LDCPSCGRELTTLILEQYPVRRTDVLRVTGGDPQTGLQVEPAGQPRLEPMVYALRWVECPRCGHHLGDEIVEGLRFPEPEMPEGVIERCGELLDNDIGPG